MHCGGLEGFRPRRDVPVELAAGPIMETRMKLRLILALLSV
jgi:hypothetical protein